MSWSLVFVGVAAGLLAGTFGVGGGIVLVPLLVWLGFDRHRAHATSLSAIVPIGLAGALTFAGAGELAVAAGVTIGVGGVIGSGIGATVMHRSSPRMLTVVFSLVLVLAGVRMILGGEGLGAGSVLDETAQVMAGLGIGVFGGLFAGLSGVGGGVIIVPAAVFFMGLSQHAAQGTSLLAIIFTAVSATAVNVRNGRVRLADGLVVGVGGVAGSLLGARIALGAQDRVLSFAFGCLVLFVAAQSLYRVLRQPEA
ncbi:MAG: sulfite exporter TauE/SafE family protein [Actinobacteria bacterium]|nr:sulfite exporter TauE/SafE family protein [Actinomycetota bacterium]